MIMACPTCQAFRWQWERYPFGDFLCCLACTTSYPLAAPVQPHPDVTEAQRRSAARRDQERAGDKAWRPGEGSRRTGGPSPDGPAVAPRGATEGGGRNLGAQTGDPAEAGRRREDEQR